MKKRKGIIIAVIIVVAAALIIAGIARGRGVKPEVVKVTDVTKGDLKSYLSTNAVIASKNEKSYIGAAQLTVKKINVKVGDKVSKGKVMLEYDLYDLNTSVSQARVQYNNAVLQKEDTVKQNDKIQEDIKTLDKQIKELEASKNPSDLVQVDGLKKQRQALQPVKLCFEEAFAGPFRQLQRLVNDLQCLLDVSLPTQNFGQQR